MLRLKVECNIQIIFLVHTSSPFCLKMSVVFEKKKMIMKNTFRKTFIDFLPFFDTLKTTEYEEKTEFSSIICKMLGNRQLSKVL
jgi:hypothetical protein